MISPVSLRTLGAALVAAALTVSSWAQEAPTRNLALAFGPGESSELAADGSSTLGIEVHLVGDPEQGTDIMAWSYGVAVDTDVLEVVGGAPGADGQALRAGAGPDFMNYNLDDQSEDGQVKGVTVGAVIELGAPGTEVLTVPAAGDRHLDTITVRAVNVIEAGGDPVSTELRFVDQSLGGDRPLEILVVVEGFGLVPDFSDTYAVTLQGASFVPQFMRGDANADARIDIADGIWIINWLFYGGPATTCQPAADSNADSNVDLSDALFLFNYQLQPGATPGNLFPAPLAPFPECGAADDATAENCPAGSSPCTGA